MLKKNKMNLKPRKHKKKKILLYSLIIHSFFSFTFYNCMKQNKNINNEKLIKFLLKGGNVEELKQYKLTNIINNSFNYLLKIDFTKPKTLLNKTIFQEQKKSIIVEHNDDYSNMEELKEISSYIEDPYKKDVNNPIIYLYNSHQLENYANDKLEIYGITPNVLMASYLLKERLNKIGISTIVEETNLTEFLNLNNWNYTSSYKASRVFILDKKNTYSSLTYFIDIHRDSVSKNISTTNINNKDYAKVLFVVGLEHNNFEKNLEIANKINNLTNKYYPSLSRGILKKSGAGVDGIYNQDISPNSILIEVGAVENNINEVFNTIEALSKILTYLIKGE